jgi:hypothetical protein
MVLHLPNPDPETISGHLSQEQLYVYIFANELLNRHELRFIPEHLKNCNECWKWLEALDSVYGDLRLHAGGIYMRISNIATDN